MILYISVDMVGVVMIIDLNQGQQTIIDDEDWDKVNHINWCADKDTANPGKYYVRGLNKATNKKVRLHRYLSNAPKGMEVDHINGNTLDNRKCNLRICTKSQNQMNRGKTKKNKSGYKGVSWCTSCNGWKAYLWTGEKNLYLGLFSFKKEAALAYNRASIKHHGEFAYVNKIK